MTRLCIRTVLWSSLTIGSLAMTGCPKPEKPPVVEPPKAEPPRPKGDLLRFSEKAGDKGQGKVSIRLENEPLNAKPGRKGALPGRLMRAYTLTEEHTVVSVDADGTQHLSGRLLDVEGKTDNPKEQREADGLARALSEIKINFDRTARGEVISAKLDIADVNKPLDPSTARIVAGSIFGAGRGSIFAEKNVDVGETWPIRSEVPIPTGGSNNWEIEYKYEKKEGTIATISFNGKSSGESSGAQLTGDVSGELRFDVAAGSLVSYRVDTKSARDPGAGAAIPGAVLRVHVEWDGAQAAAQVAPAQAAPAPAAPAQAAPASK